MVVNGRPVVKRLKRRVTADLTDFLTFASADDDVYGGLEGPFRENVRCFVSKHARVPPLFAPAVFPHLLTWQIAFRIGERDCQDATQGAVVALDVIEEDVMRSRSVYCDHCRVVGWSSHPVCSKRYHFIIRADGSSADGYNRPCTRCGTLLDSLDLRCKSCNYQITSDDLEDWLYMQLADTTHLLHGVVHANGYGHLLRINGIEGGSKHLSGCDIMNFWDRLCKMLGIRKISVMDVSKKYGLEYRLLHAVTSSCPWYGEWGYEFGTGSFGLTADAYKQAVDTLSNLPLAPFFTNDRVPQPQLNVILTLYMSLADHRLVTVRDLFRFVTGLLHDMHRQEEGSSKKLVPSDSAMALLPWCRDDIERVERVMFKILCAVGESFWVSWRALRRSASTAGPPELLDFCIKGMGGKAFGDKVVRTRCNKETLEYSIATSSSSSSSTSTSSPPLADEDIACSRSQPNLLDSITEEHIRRDLKVLYDALLHPDTMALPYKSPVMRERCTSTALKLLDCKQFVKDYEPAYMKALNPFVLKVWCLAVFANQPKDQCTAPPELLVLPASANVGDLKLEAKKAFQEVYIPFKRLMVEQLLDYGHVGDETHVKLLIGPVGSVKVRCRCFLTHGLHRFRMERGTETWTVECCCGARDDDGERMLACDACGVWQHTRCAGIPDSHTVPARFVCDKCRKLTKPKTATGGGGGGLSKRQHKCHGHVNGLGIDVTFEVQQSAASNVR